MGATLIYSQVDRAFKGGCTGRGCPRFRNAKLAYYRGDFKWAQSQLSACQKPLPPTLLPTMRYIFLCLLRKNIPADSNLTPLLRFAAADLLLFANQTATSDKLLDSISTAFPPSGI